MRRTDSVSSRCRARGLEEQAAALERRARGSRKLKSSGPSGRSPIERDRTNWPGLRGVLEKDGQAIDQQSLRNPIEHGAEQRFETHFVRERAAEFDQRAAIVEAVAIEKVIETRLHPIAQGLETGTRPPRSRSLPRPGPWAMRVWKSSPISAMRREINADDRRR